MSKAKTVTISRDYLNSLIDSKLNLAIRLEEYQAFNLEKLTELDQKDNAIRILREDMHRLRDMVEHEQGHAAALLKMNDNLRDMQKKEKVAFTNLDNHAMEHIRKQDDTIAALRVQLQSANNQIRDSYEESDKLRAEINNRAEYIRMQDKMIADMAVEIEVLNRKYRAW